jgi:hypothetical protein
MAMLKVMTNCAAGMPPIVPNTSTASVTSSWKMPMTHMPAVRGPQQAPFPTMLPATTGKSYNAKVIIDRDCQHPLESFSDHKSCSTRSASYVVVMSS